MSSRTSKGCLQCRTRKVKCDEGRPSCRRCVQRGELCTGYRDEVDRFFRHETGKTVEKSLRRRTSLAEGTIPEIGDIFHPNGPPRRIPEQLGCLKLRSGTSERNPSSTNQDSGRVVLDPEEPSVSQFFEKYVLFPCNPSSSPGFLEHLPSLFKQGYESGRKALRWAVQAAASASLASDSNDDHIRREALYCYGQSLTSLGESLAESHKTPDDYDLMTVVVLDIFESVFLDDASTRGSHVQGMAQILRLRGPDQIHSPRGWSLFRLAHHRILKEQLAYKQPPLPDSETLLTSLETHSSEIHVEKDNLEIAKVCQRARDLVANIDNQNISSNEAWQMIQELLAHDQTATSWRSGPEWCYKTINREDIIRQNPAATSHSILHSLPQAIELHPDIWISYEWNYHRTARIILHEHLIRCLDGLSQTTTRGFESEGILAIKTRSLDTIRTLAGQMLSTVPQSLGDVDGQGRVLGATGTSDGAASVSSTRSKCRAIGAYFLLWPIKIIKSTVSASEEQRAEAKGVFQRIRECTGMKDALGERSNI